MPNNTLITQKVTEIYDWLNLEIKAHSDIIGKCNACGKCCYFEKYDHRLFVTTPELMYLKTKLGVEKLKSMPTGTCPYNINGECTIHRYRFASCRIFCCNGDKDLQSRLSESVLEEIKSICTECQIPYRYTDLPTALNTREN